MDKAPYDVMDLKALRCFWTMAKNLSFTQAGVELGISETAVSARVKSLESYLQVKLYEARGGRVRLTPAGQRTFEQATSTFEQLDAFENVIAHAEAEVELTLCTYDDVLHYRLPGVVKTFGQLYPQSTLRLLSRSMQRCLQLVRTNEADVAICGDVDVPDELEMEPIASFPGAILLPKGHPLAGRPAEEFWSQLDEATVRRYPLIISEGQRSSKPLHDALARLRLPLVVGFEVTTVETLKCYVREGLGIAAVSTLCLTDEDRGQFEIIEAPAEVGGASHYGIVLRTGKHRSAPLETLLGLIRDGFHS